MLWGPRSVSRRPKEAPKRARVAPIILFNNKFWALPGLSWGLLATFGGPDWGALGPKKRFQTAQRGPQESPGSANNLIQQQILGTTWALLGASCDVWGALLGCFGAKEAFPDSSMRPPREPRYCPFNKFWALPGLSWGSMIMMMMIMFTMTRTIRCFLLQGDPVTNI